MVTVSFTKTNRQATHLEAVRLFLTESKIPLNSAQRATSQQTGFFGKYFAKFNTNSLDLITTWTEEFDSLNKSEKAYASEIMSVFENPFSVEFPRRDEYKFQLKYYPSRNHSIGLIRAGFEHYVEAALEFVDGKIREITGIDNTIYDMHLTNSELFIELINKKYF